jgi:hypothetical protein
MQVKWLTLENETAERVLKQHGMVSRICKDKFTGDPYAGNVSLCKKIAASEDGERSMPWIRIEDAEPLDKTKACKKCVKSFERLTN